MYVPIAKIDFQNLLYLSRIVGGGEGRGKEEEDKRRMSKFLGVMRRCALQAIPLHRPGKVRH